MTRTDTPALPAPSPDAPSLDVPGLRDGPRGNPGDALVAAQRETRRGLKAGASALADARTAYGEAQWCGEHDRRPEPGLLVRARL